MPSRRIPIGFVIAVLLAVACWWMLSRSTLGFRFNTVGANKHAARYAGINISRIVTLSMVLGGGLAGLAGALEAAGTLHRFEPAIGGTLGFDGITIALLARANPLATIPAALLVGILRTGAAGLQFETGIAPGGRRPPPRDRSCSWSRSRCSASGSSAAAPTRSPPPRRAGGTDVTTAWIAKNRTTLIVTVVVLVAAYVFYYAKNGIAPEHVHLGMGLRHPARPRRARRRHRRALRRGQHRHRGPDARRGLRRLLRRGLQRVAPRRRPRGHRQRPHPRRLPRLDDGEVADGPDHRRCGAQHHRDRHHVVLLQAGQAPARA